MDKFKDKFDLVLRDDETVLWTGDVNRKAYLRKWMKNLAVFGLFPMFLPFMILAMTVFVPITIYVIRRNATKIFLCVTDKQIILRMGYFTPDYYRMGMSRVGEIDIKTSVFDSKSPPKSATLEIRSKDYSVGKNMRSGTRLYVSNLYDAHEAYKLISKHTDNDAMKIRKVD